MAPAMLSGSLGLLGWYLIDLAVNVVGWAVSAPLKTEKYYDMVGSAAFQCLAWGTLFVPGPATSRKIFLSAAVIVWTVRLGLFLVIRIYLTGSDSRFDDLKKGPLKFLIAWLIQSVWVWMSILPVLLVNLEDNPKDLDYPDLAGSLIYLLGLVTETVADFQKLLFKRNPANKGRFISTGLWSLSRHPNYVGEILVWWGIWGVCAVDFAESQPARFISVVSPLFIMCLLSFGSGVPLLETSAESRWGGQPAYEEYKAKTPILLPFCNWWWGPDAFKTHEPLRTIENGSSGSSTNTGAGQA